MWSILAAAAVFTASPVGAQVPQQLSQQTAFADPPGRIARMNLAEGPVSYAPANTGGDPRWTPAVLNRPLTTGDRLWTGQRARSELHIGSTAVRLSEQTSLDFLELDDDSTQLRLAQGTMKLRVRKLFDGQRIEINTPNLAFVITHPGDYRIDANPASNIGAGTTRVVVQQGSGTIYGDGGAQVNIASGQQAHFTDTQLTPAGPAPEVQDSFDAWAHERDRLEDQSVSARYVPREVVGYQQLDSYGDWNQDPTYGAVWLPRAVPANWAPYRDGHWSWIAPWGWTWVDDAPWGFAPFHYGRWAQIGPRWGWVPGQLAARPVYAPALVAFIGGNAGGVNWNVAIGQQRPRPGLGWFPLAPGEAFRPAYRHSPRYVSNVNHNIVVNNLNVTNNYRYQRRGDAVSAMSAEDFARGQRVRPEGHRLNPVDLGRAPLIAPERGGLPPRVANLRDLPRVASPAALPPAAVAVRPVVTSQALPGQRDDRRNDRREDRRDERREERREERNDGRQNDPRDAARIGRPGEALGQWPRPAQPVIAPPGAAPDRSALEAEQRARAEQQRQQRDIARQQQDRVGGQRPPGDESPGQRALREQAQRNGTVNSQINSNPNLAMPPVQPGRPEAGRDPIEQAQREQQRLQRDQQRQQIDAARQQEQQRRQSDESLSRRALQEQAQRQQQAQRQAQEQQMQQAQQAQQRAQQDQQRQAREQQQQLQQQQRQQQDQARQQQAAEQQALQAQQRAQQDQQRQAAQQQAQRQQAQEQQAQQQAQQAQQRAQQDQVRQQQMAQQQQQQLQRAQQEQQRQAREQQQLMQQQRQQPDQPREAGREQRQSPRRADATGGAPPRLDERFNR